MTVICVKCEKPSVRPKVLENTRSINYPKLNKMLKHTVWVPVFLALSASDAFKEFMSILTLCIDKSSQQKCSSNNYCKAIKQWISNKLLEKIRLKNALYKESKMQPANNDLLKQFKH